MTAPVDRDDIFCIDEVLHVDASGGKTPSGKHIVSCTIGGVHTTAEIDSGSGCNLMGADMWEYLKNTGVVTHNQQKGSDREFSVYGGRALSVRGTFEAKLVVNTKQA